MTGELHFSLRRTQNEKRQQAPITYWAAVTGKGFQAFQRDFKIGRQSVRDEESAEALNKRLRGFLETNNRGQAAATPGPEGQGGTARSRVLELGAGATEEMLPEREMGD